MTSIDSELIRYRGALMLDRVFQRHARRIVQIALIVTVGFLAVLLGYFFITDPDPKSRSLFFSPQGTYSVYLGALMIALSFLALVKMLIFFYQSRYFSGVASILHEDEHDTEGMTYEVAEALSHARTDVTLGFLSTSVGRQVLYRCGIFDEAIDQYCESARTALSSDQLSIPPNEFLTMEHLGRFVYENDVSLRDFLFKLGVTNEVYRGALAWTARLSFEEKKRARWWSRDNLGAINGLGKDFSYGIAYELQKYIRSLRTTTVFSSLAGDVAYGDEAIIKIETILSRAKEANVLVVGEAGAGTMDVLVRVNEKIRKGKSVASALGKQFMLFDWEAFIATHPTKETFEASFMKMFAQAERAGNIIIVIENIAKFFASTASLGVDAGDILDRYLTSSDLHIVATSDPSQYHEHIEREPQFVGRFELVRIESPGLTGIVRILEDVAVRYEATHGVVFTYASILALAEGADRYIVEGVMPDKAVDLLVEVVPVAKQKGAVLITREFVETYIGGKTGIPTGPVGGAERDLLLNLEKTLHARVVGQHAAIEAIANAMRRARAGVGAKDRPMGAFLFLGSTGVGKTETAKALAAVFFGDESKMSRIDMSEFSGADALSRLMGDSASSGALPVMLREHPYGVVLLDEFEKATRDVHNLFLQILDEGIFTDGRGEKVNARNSIIIATSNAGSSLIFDIVGRGENPAEKKDEIINALIADKLYAPELINRFDDVIIFEPLKSDEQKQIATLMLAELSARIKEKGYTLVVNDALLNALAQEGYSPQFGARPMRRLIQDVVEKKIAEKIIAGSLKFGDSVAFTAEDFK